MSSEPLVRSDTTAARSGRIAALIERTMGRRGASTLVRETAASQIEERRILWGYSGPVVALDIVWNLSFALTALSTLGTTLSEKPNVPIRLWIAGYALQSFVHVALVSLEFRRRNRRPSIEEGNESEEDEELGSRSFAKRCEALNTVVSFLWWTAGFYWVVSGGDDLPQNAPTLYWLSVVFLAVDVFFAILCIALACVVGIALCCCLPCIIAILYAVAGQEGASDGDINILPKYKFVQESSEAGKMVSLEGEEQLLSKEDAECCICLSSYEDGAELQGLPCNHHFHAPCITRWLRINATCPLCKYNILKGGE